MTLLPITCFTTIDSLRRRLVNTVTLLVCLGTQFNLCGSDNYLSDWTLPPQKKCASVILASGYRIDLFENMTLSRRQFDAVYLGRLESATFEVPNQCHLQICGLNADAGPPYIYGTCELYFPPIARASWFIYNGIYEVSHMSCACKDVDNGVCMKEPCKSRGVEYHWSGLQCALLFQEPKCQSCLFNPIPLEYGKKFLTSNSFAIMSTIVRPGCMVENHYSGWIRLTRRKIKLTDLYIGESENIRPIFQKETGNFTCLCSQSVLDEMWTTLPIHPRPSTSFMEFDETVRHKKYVTRRFWQSVISIVFFSSFLYTLKKVCARKKRIVTVADEKEEEIPLIELPRTDLTKKFNRECAPRYQIPRNIYDKHEEPLSSGVFIYIFKGSITMNPEKAAADIIVKTLKPQAKRKIIRSFFREIKILQLVNSHENMVRFIGACYDNEELDILIRLYEKGSLKKFLTDKFRSQIPVQKTSPVWSAVKFLDKSSKVKPFQLEAADRHQFIHWLEQIAAGMEYLNLKKIIHVSLTVGNIFLGYNLTVKLSEFALAKSFRRNKTVPAKFFQRRFPANSVAPECLIDYEFILYSKGKLFPVAVDVWSFGNTIWEIFSLGEDPYEGMTHTEVKEFVENKNRLFRPALAPEFVYDKMEECWAEDPLDRPTFFTLQAYFRSHRPGFY